MDGMIKGGERVRDVVRSFDSRERNTRKFFDFTILAVINSQHLHTPLVLQPLETAVSKSQNSREYCD